jgi:hypothetical protein
MIADLDETIKQMLIADMPIKNGEIDIKFDQPKREWSAKLVKPTINFFLYDVRENTQLRRSQYDQVKNGNAQEMMARMKKAPHRIDCYYILTTWAAEAEDEHRLLTRTLMSLFRNPSIPDHVLQGTLRNPRYPLNTHVARHDKLTNPAEVWSALDNEMRPSVSFTVTIALDPWSEVTGPLVRSFTMQTGQSTSLPLLQEFDEGTAGFDLNYIGGIIRSKSGDGEPKTGLEVAIKGRGWFDVTDEDGRFRLGAMPPGSYTLVIWPEKGKPKEKKITVPATDGDYNLVI